MLNLHNVHDFKWLDDDSILYKKCLNFYSNANRYINLKTCPYPCEINLGAVMLPVKEVLNHSGCSSCRFVS